MNQELFNDQFRMRTKRLALDIIGLLAPLKYSDPLGVMRKQIIRSSTSVAANFRASCRGRSERELFAKLCIVVEEADETLLWLEFLVEAGYLSPSETVYIEKEAIEILKVMSSYKKRIGQKI